MPLLIAALAGVAATATLARNGLTTVRRRRRELAILKTLGFTRAQVRATLAWHATTVGAIATRRACRSAPGPDGGPGTRRRTHGVAPEPVTPRGSMMLVVQRRFCGEPRRVVPGALAHDPDPPRPASRVTT